MCGHTQPRSLGTADPNDGAYYGDNLPPCSGSQCLPLSGLLPCVGFSLGKSFSNSKVGSKPNKKWTDSSPNLSFPRMKKEVCGRGQAEFVWDDLACTSQVLE